jgi:seryl-tRNA synthetase
VKGQTQAKDQTYWKGRITQAREQLDRSKILLDALQSRINALSTDFVNTDDPARRSVIERDRQRALAETERLKKEIADQTKAIAAIEEEARRAGVPAGWLR